MLFPYLFTLFFSIAYSQINIEGKPPSEISKFPILKKMTFRKPITFTPLDVKIGYLYYGGKNYSMNLPFNSSEVTPDDMPVLLDSTQYEFNIIENSVKRKLLFIELDILRTNLTNFFFHQNYVDLQMGLGLQIINFLPDLSLPLDTGKEWLNNSSNKGEYFFHPKSVGININTSLAWQLSYGHLYYLYHSMGLSSVSLYESAGNHKNLSGLGLSESFGIGTKFVFVQENANFNYTLGIEAKWNRLYLNSIDAPEDFTPIEGIDMRASGIFISYGVQFGGNKTDGDVAYSLMMQSDFMGASESFKKFLDIEQRHINRGKAIEMLQYCQSQIPYQQIKYGVDAYLNADYKKTIEWFDAAEINATEKLKKEIKANRQIISSELLDSIINHKNKMSITNAQNLANVAKDFHPNSKKYEQVLAGLYLDKAQLNMKIKNYSGAVENYQKALDFYPEIHPLINDKIQKIINAMMKDAYFSYEENKILKVLDFINYLVHLQPQLSNEFDPYILKLKNQIKKNKEETLIVDFQKHISNEKHESLPLDQQGVLLGMTENKVKMILGEPKHIENIQNYELWTYPEQEPTSYLYFRDKLLFRIE